MKLSRQAKHREYFLSKSYFPAHFFSLMDQCMSVYGAATRGGYCNTASCSFNLENYWQAGVFLFCSRGQLRKLIDITCLF